MHSESILFYDLWLEYNDYKQLNLKPQSYRKFINNFKNHILPFFGNYRLDEITSKIYIQWLTIIDKQGFKNSFNKNLHGSMVTMFNYALKFGYIDKNIPQLVGGIRKKRNDKNRFDVWTFEEFIRFIQVVDDETYYALFYTLFYTGLRIGECLALTWNDFDEICLDINKTIAKETDEKGNRIINSPKTESSYRTVLIDPLLVQKLNNIYQHQSEHDYFNKEWYIFGGAKPLSQTTVARKKDFYCEKSGVKKIRLHDLRHSHATLLMSCGMSVTAIAKRLGHADTNMTLNTYSHCLIQDEYKIIELINSLNASANIH